MLNINAMATNVQLTTRFLVPLKLHPFQDMCRVPQKTDSHWDFVHW